MHRSILATLTYYDSFRWPLTLMELYERRISESRLGGARSEASYTDVLRHVDALQSNGFIQSRYGLYALADSEDSLSSYRMTAEKEWAQKWRRMRRYSAWLQAAPFVRSIVASGSLALGNARPQSDWDMLVITAKDRLYTARACLLGIAWIMRRLRRKEHATAPDLFCFNHYRTIDTLTVRHRSLYVAHTLAGLVPLYDPDQILERFWIANRWMQGYIRHTPGVQVMHRSVPRHSVAYGVARIGEAILSTRFGNLVERILRSWQQHRIATNPSLYREQGRIVADAYEIAFHPHSFEHTVLAHYEGALATMGVGVYRERISNIS